METQRPSSHSSSRKVGRNSMFAGDMWAVFNFDNPNARYQKFLQKANLRFSHLFDGLLLYDDVVVPTQDFLSLTILVGLLGQKVVLDLLEGGDLRFVRLKGALAYVGNGGGLQPYAIRDKGGKPDPSFADTEQAAIWALEGLEQTKIDPALPRVVSANTTVIDAAAIADHVRHETYMDVLNSGYLRSLLSIRNTDMDHLAGIAPNEVRCYGGPDDSSKRGDEIDIVLDICAANLELRLSERAGCDDASTAAAVGHLLRGKTERTLQGRVPFESLVRLMEINGVPNVAGFVLNEPLQERGAALQSIMQVKRSRDGKAFRGWFHANCRDNPDEVAAHYIEVLKRVPAISQTPARVVRFLVTSVLGLIPALGTLSSAVDSFFIERWLRGHSPKFFIEDLKQVANR